MPRILGIDPGIHGGLAIVEITDGAAPRLVDAIDIPTVGVAAKQRADATAVAAFIRLHQPQHVFIERAQAMPKQGASSGFKYGRAVGALEAAVVCCGHRGGRVEASSWVAPGRQGSEPATRPAVVPRSACITRPQNGSRTRRGCADRV